MSVLFSSNLRDLLKVPDDDDRREATTTLASIIASEERDTVSGGGPRAAAVRTLLDVIREDDSGSAGSVNGSLTWRALTDQILHRSGGASMASTSSSFTSTRRYLRRDFSEIHSAARPPSTGERDYVAGSMIQPIPPTAASDRASDPPPPPPPPPARMSLMALLEQTDTMSAGNLDCSPAEISEAEDEQPEEIPARPQTCCVCMVREKGAAFIPCGHTFCRLCSRELRASRRSCPLCNGLILEILDLY